MKGTGKITVNGKEINDFFPNQFMIKDAKQGLVLTENTETFDIIATLNGGGFSGQAGALRHGIVRALMQYDAELRKILKPAGLVTRDSRSKERKKPGLKKARKAPQFSKR